MRRSLAVLALFCALVPACTSGAEVETAPETPAAGFEAPPRVRPPRVRSELDPKALERCMPKERVDVASLAGRYFGPIDFTTDQVQAVRELDFTAPSDIDLVEPDEFRRLVKETDTRFEPKERAANRWLQWTLGFRRLGTDGSTQPKGDGAELVAGFYSPSDQNIVVRQEGEIDNEYPTLAHELAHAAVDQVFGLPKDRSGLLIDDETLALTALIEGDATLAGLQFTARFAGEKSMKKTLESVFKNEKTYNRERAAGTPHAVIERFMFPYRWGLRFVCSVYRKGGWQAVNRAYSRPPTTSADIIFPERYLAKVRPARPAGFDKLPKPWKVYGTGTIGPMHLKAMFEAPADYERAALRNPVGRVAAWAGGRYSIWGQEPKDVDSVFGMSLVERKQHEGVLCSSLMDWYKATFNYAEREVIADGTVAYSDPTRTSILACDGPNVRFAMAPSRLLAEKVAGL